MTQPPMPSGQVRVRITDPQGPRAAVPYPPFPDMLPVIAFDVVPLNGQPKPAEAVRVVLDCTGHPDAAAFLSTPAPGQRLGVFIGMQAHETGNGYVVLAIRNFDLEPTRNGERTPSLLDVVLDPVVHATLIEELIRTGYIRLVAAANDLDRAPSWTFDVQAEALARTAQQAREHPRSVVMRFGAAAHDVPAD